MPKRAKLTGVDRLFQGSESVATAPPTSDAGQPEATRWEERFHRRTFYCADDNWAALQAWCQRTGTSHSAALNAAIEAFLGKDKG